MDLLASLGDSERTKVGEFFEFQMRFDGYLRKKAIAKLENAMTQHSTSDRQEKFLAGRIAYGGEFTPEGIQIEMEINQEALDAQNYSDIEEFILFSSDPEKYSEIVAHSMYEI